MGDLPDWMYGHLSPIPPVRRPGLARRLADAIGGYRTNLCPVAGCEVQVQVRGLGADLECLYQELATDHTRHNAL